MRRPMPRRTERPRRNAPWLCLPVLGAPIAHAPVLVFDLLPALKRPIDGGRTLGGRRILGDNKTWRGGAVMFAGVLAATTALHRVQAYRERLPPDVRAAGPLKTGALLGLATVAGEFPNSFAKRRLGIAPGGHRSGPAGVVVATAFATVAAVHVPINLVGYRVGARTTPV